MASFLKFMSLGTKAANDTPEKKRSVRALPGPWYYSSDFYQLERRAIFSRQWLMMTHKNRFAEPGDFLRYEFAGFDVVINMDRQRNFRAFHNICRHRAYQVVEKDSGKASIFACRYHGWSYGLNGKLAKAPDYDQLEGFKKEDNSLLKIHTHVDEIGFIWINLDASGDPEIAWGDQFAGVDRQARFQDFGFNFDDYVLDHTYQVEGNHNWKLLADNFNECYHCKTTHPDVPTFMTIDSHSVEVRDGHMQHDQAATEEQKKKGFNVNSTYYFPNVSMSVAPHWLMIQRFLPKGPTNAVMHYEIFRNKNSKYEDFKVLADTYARVMSEDKVLCLGAQKNIERGVFVAGEMHPRWEKGPLYFQSQCRQAVTEHWRREQLDGAEFWPARQKVENNEVNRMDSDMCSGMACENEKGIFEW